MEIPITKVDISAGTYIPAPGLIDRTPVEKLYFFVRLLLWLHQRHVRTHMNKLG